MPRKKKLSAADQAQKEAEALASTIRTDGQGEHPAVQALMSPEFEKMSNLDASQIALMLQQIIRGEMSLISQQNNIQIAQLRERQDQADREIAERFESQQKFIEEVLDRAEKIQRTGEAKDQLIANGVAEYTKAKHNAVAEMTMSNLAFRKKLNSEKKVPYISPGQLVTVMENGQQVPRIIPEEVHIKDIHMRIPAGVPIIIARCNCGDGNFKNQLVIAGCEISNETRFLGCHTIEPCTIPELVFLCELTIHQLVSVSTVCIEKTILISFEEWHLQFSCNSTPQFSQRGS